MELISSSRIIKAQQRVRAAQPYAEAMRRLVSSVAQNASNVDHPLLKERDEVRSVGHIVISSDRGLAGAYNSNVIRAAERDMQQHGKDAKLYLVGKKAVSYFRFRGYDFEDSWTGVSDQPSIGDAREDRRRRSEGFHRRSGRSGEARLHEVRVGPGAAPHRHPGAAAAPRGARTR